MGYTIFTREQVFPKNHPGSGALNYGPPPTYPAGAALCYLPPDLDIWSGDPTARRVLLADPNGTASDADIMAAFPKILDAKYDRLWKAAAEWERRNISGVGLSILALGVAQGKPKALACAQWSANLWGDKAANTGIYYPRKALIGLDTEPNCDFTVAGDMPFTVSELAAEVWGSPPP